MCITTLHQNNITTEPSHLLVGWRCAYQTDIKTDIRLACYVGTKVSLIHQRKRNLPHNNHCDVFSSVSLLSLAYQELVVHWFPNSVLFALLDRIAAWTVKASERTLTTKLRIPRLAGSSRSQEQ